MPVNEPLSVAVTEKDLFPLVQIVKPLFAVGLVIFGFILFTNV